MSPITLDRQEDVFVLRMHSGENRFNYAFFDAFDRALDEILASRGPAALVVVGEGKFFSNGIDLDWLGRDGVDLLEFSQRLHSFLARIVAFPVPAVAALNGHAFAGGAMMALAFDFRVMRADRGYFCLPEVDISIPFTEPLSALVRHRLAPQVAHQAMVTGKRYDATEALALAIVDEVGTEAEVLPKALGRAAALAGKDRATLGAIKRNAAVHTLALLEGSLTKGLRVPGQ